MFFISLSKEIEANCVKLEEFWTADDDDDHICIYRNRRLSPCLTRPLGCVCPPENESGGESRAAHADQRFLLSVCGVVSVGHLGDRHRGEEQGAQRQDL